MAKTKVVVEVVSPAILSCTCGNSFQDETYGKGKRVMNPTHKVDCYNKRQYRCTVCLEMRSI